MRNCIFLAVFILSLSPSAYGQDIDMFEVQEAPVCLNLAEVRKMIIYPDSAVAHEIEGRVVVKLLTDTDGTVIKTGDLMGPEIFYEEIKRVSMYLRFSPGKVNGKPVKVWVSVPFNFKFKNKN